MPSLHVKAKAKYLVASKMAKSEDPVQKKPSKGKGTKVHLFSYRGFPLSDTSIEYVAEKLNTYANTTDADLGQVDVEEELKGFVAWLVRRGLYVPPELEIFRPKPKLSKHLEELIEEYKTACQLNSEAKKIETLENYLFLEISALEDRLRRAEKKLKDEGYDED